MKLLLLLLLLLALSILLATTHQMILACHANADTEDLETNKVMAKSYSAWSHIKSKAFFKKSDGYVEPPACVNCLIKAKQAQK